MPKIRKEIFFSPFGIFVIYMLASGLAIMCFRMIFPGEAPPLAIYSIHWRLIRGLLTYYDIFPALAFSALVIPFGFKVYAKEKITPFSPQFLEYLKMPIITAIISAIIYGLIYFLLIPLAGNYEANMRFRGRLYQLARENAQDSVTNERWEEAAQYLAICESIWPEGPDVEKLITETEIVLETARLTPDHQLDYDLSSSSMLFLPETHPLTATEAIERAGIALAEERFFDAHWLANLGSHLARPNSVEVTVAARLADEAWRGITSLEPNTAQEEAYRTYRLKREAYEAMLGREWIKAYHIFLQLEETNYRDPDIRRFLALSDAGLRQVAFFIDEMELTMGRMLTGAIFSLPFDNGRMVMRVSSLSTYPDYADGIGGELIAFNAIGQRLWSIEAPYVKFLPLSMDSRSAVTALFRAVSQTTGNVVWEPIARDLGQSAPYPGNVILDISWDDFLLLSDINRGITGLSTQDIKIVADRFGSFGYMPAVFEAELLERFIRPLFFLPFAIFSISIGWRYRALKRPRYMAIPMLGILPIVFYNCILFSRSMLGNIGIWIVVSLGFVPAIIFFSVGLLVLLIVSLIILAAQHG